MRDTDDWEVAYPQALRDCESKLFKSRPSRERANEGVSQDEPKVGVALSGGGLRSATFAFGVIQALAKRKALREIDVLSTVSGGGYIGALLTRLYSRRAVKGPDDVARAILPPHEWQEQVPDRQNQSREEENDQTRSSVWTWLKANGRYLAPAKGSGDLLLASTIILRSWLSVHVVLVSFFLAVFVGAQLLREMLDWVSFDLLNSVLGTIEYGSAVLVEAITSREPRVACTAEAPVELFRFIDHWLNCWLPLGGRYLWWSPWLLFSLLVMTLYVFLAAVTATLSCFWTGCDNSTNRDRWSPWFKKGLLPIAAFLVFAVIDTLGQTAYLISEDTKLSVWAWFAAPLAIVGAAVTLLNNRSLAAVFWGKYGNERLRLSRKVGAIIAAIVLVAVALTLASALSHGIAWGFKYPSYVHRTFLESPLRAQEGRRNTVSSAHPCIGEAPQGPEIVPCPGSDALQVLDCPDCVMVGERRVAWLSGWFIVLVALSGVFGRCRALLNDSSLCSFYTARLIRAYLGASNPKRVARRTVSHVLDGDDTSSEWASKALDGLSKGAPLHLVNVTINETVEGSSGIQHNDRSGIGMAISPAGISAGVRHHLVFENVIKDRSWNTAKVFPVKEPTTNQEEAPPVYRMFEYEVEDDSPEEPHIRYGGERLTLGQWTGISGAAFSTGMGARTSLAMSLLFGFLNVRLGYWWDSKIKPRDRKAAVAQKHWFARLLPVHSHLFDEFTARFRGPARRWWNLSDGGHFENMGGYELIRRRLPLIVVVDAEADPEYRFEGLGNLVRKARIDFGAEIEFDDVGKTVGTYAFRELAHHDLGTLEMLRRRNRVTPVKTVDGGHTHRSVSETPSYSLRSIAHAALARVRYLDGATPDSLLVYVKPTVLGEEPVDILHYQAANPDFPQQTTADQFFDEAQWESYRKLGYFVADKVFRDGFQPYLRLRNNHLI